MIHSATRTAPRFKVTFKGTAYWLPDGKYTLGRSELCNIVLDDTRASRCHARLVVEASMSIEVWNSANEHS